MLLQDKVAFVTGGGAGLGKAIVLRYLQEGAMVIASDINEQSLLALTKEAASERLFTIQGDVSCGADQKRWFQFVGEKIGRLDILVNNAGISEGMLPVDEVSDEVWDKMLAVNLTGPFLACREAVAIMLQQESGGSIINMASAAGVGGGRAGASYVASKFGLVGLSKNIAYMYGPKNIRCNVICPGYVPTEMGNAGGVVSQYGMQRVAEGTKPIRSGRPEEIAGLALFLASDLSSLVSGETILADAGKGAY